MSIGRWMDKEVVAHIHNGILLSYKKEGIWLSANEVDEPGASYTERSQSERERQILILMHIYMEFRKTVATILHAGKQRRQTLTEHTFRLGERRRGWDDLREEQWNIYTPICKTDDQCKFSAWRGHPKPVLWDNPEGQGGEGGGMGVQEGRTHVYLRPIHVDIWQKPSEYGIVIIFWLK